jgi:hypothetical protein
MDTIFHLILSIYFLFKKNNIMMSILKFVRHIMAGNNTIACFVVKLIHENVNSLNEIN